MTSILVTGATTPLGRLLVRRLLADDRVGHVLAVGLEEPEVMPDFTGKRRLTWLAADLTRSRTVRQLLFGPVRDLEIGIVVHLAQHRSVRRRGRKVHQLNVEALRAMLELADHHPIIRRLVVRSFADVYRVSIDLPMLVTEAHPLAFNGGAQQYVRDRVEADLTACARIGSAGCEIAVLRCAEALEPATGSQLFEYLNAPLVLRPAGFDPMLNLASTTDLVEALTAAAFSEARGVFNIPGYDTLPVSECIHRWGTPELVLPGPVVASAYRLAERVLGLDFSYAASRRRLHYGLVLDGSRARAELGYVPSHPIDWPVGGPVWRKGEGGEAGARWEARARE